MNKYEFKSFFGNKNFRSVLSLREEIFVKEDGYSIDAILSEFDKVSQHFIVENHKMIVGAISVAVNDSSLPIEKYIDLQKHKKGLISAEIHKLAVLKGERFGFISFCLMVDAFEFAVEKGAKNIFLFSLKNKIENIKLYSKYGFEVIEEFMYGEVGNAVVMRMEVPKSMKAVKQNKRRIQIAHELKQRLNK